MASTSTPYPGLRPFRQDEHLLFFGRFDQTAALYRLLDCGHFLAVVGGSGSGKSSLVHAGLLPLLAGETNPRGAERWLIVTLRPGVHPVNRLAAALCEAAGTATDQLERVAAGLRRTSGGLADEVGRLFPVDREVLILVDQVEELFRYVDAASGDVLPSVDRSALQAAQEDEARRFVDGLLTASSMARRIRVVLTMRSDFIGDCAQFPGLAEAVSGNQYLTPRLDRDQLTEAIIGPLLRVSGRLDPDARELPRLEPDEWADLIEPRLVEQLKNDAGDNPDQLPALQHTLLRCWQTADGARLDLDRYRALGGWGKVLSGHADEVQQRCGPARRQVVEHVFRALTELERGGRAIRRALTMTQLVAETGDPDPDVRTVVAEFSAPDCSFLVPPMPPDELVDIGHEALIRNWSILKESWIEAERRDRDRWRSLLELTASKDRIGKALIDWWHTRRPSAAWAARWSGRPAEVELQRVAAHVVWSEDDFKRGLLDEAGQTEPLLDQSSEPSHAGLDRLLATFSENSRTQPLRIEPRLPRDFVMGFVTILTISDSSARLLQRIINADIDPMLRIIDEIIILNRLSSENSHVQAHLDKQNNECLEEWTRYVSAYDIDYSYTIDRIRRLLAEIPSIFNGMKASIYAPSADVLVKCQQLARDIDNGLAQYMKHHERAQDFIADEITTILTNPARVTLSAMLKNLSDSLKKTMIKTVALNHNLLKIFESSLD